MNTNIQKEKIDNGSQLIDLPLVITDLITAQNSYDSAAFAAAFAENARVVDEGKTYKGRQEIQKWIEQANKSYRTIMKPIEYSANKKILKAEISGSFPGSPLVLHYYFEINEGFIEFLKIEG